VIVKKDFLSSNSHSVLGRAICAFMAVLLIPLWAASCHAASDFTDAHAAMTQYRDEQVAAIEAQGKQQTELVQQHQAKAKESLEGARTLYEQAGVMASRDTDAVREYATILSGTGDFDLAAEAWQRLTELAPADASGWKELGRALSALGHVRAQGALAAFRHAEQLAPDAETAFLLGRVYRQESLYDLAMESFGRALERDPAYLGARLAAAALKIQDGHVREGNADLESIGPLPPEYADEFDQRIKETVDHLIETRRILPDTAEDDMAYAKIMFLAQRLQDALEAAERSARLSPNDETILNFIGDVAARLGMRDRAREAYVRSLELKPDQPRTKERMQALDQPAK